MEKIVLILFIILVSCSSSSLRYPSSWWKEVPRENAKYWEILPQDAKAGEVILSKRNELGILSNFAHTPFILDGKKYQSIEGFWQMMKFPEDKNDERFKSSKISWKQNRKDVSELIGFMAKRAGKEGSENMKILGINWVTYQGQKMTYRAIEKGMHYNLIYQATLAKVNQNKLVKKILVKTNGLKLKPDHKQKKNTPPAWKYYEILMEIRSSL